MKSYFWGFILLAACNSNSDSSSTADSLKDPSTVQPPSQANQAQPTS